MNEKNKNHAFEWAMAHLSEKRESCGLLVDVSGEEIFIPCKNISELHDTFAIDPIDYVKAEDMGKITGVFHSHCFSSPNPSEADKVSCEATSVPWSIVSVPNGEWHHFAPSGYRAPLLGRTWLHGVLDCYSLIRDHYKEVLNIDLPDYERDFEWWLKGENLYADNFKNAGFFEVDISDIRKHDVILMQIKSPVINHAGVYEGNELFLHHLHRRLSGRDIWGGYYRKHTVKVLRHKLCAQ